MDPTTAERIYIGDDRDLQEDFNIAVNFIGEDWLEDQWNKHHNTSNDDYLGNPSPEIINWYNTAKKRLSGEHPPNILSSNAQYSGLKFFFLGALISSLRETPIRGINGIDTSKNLKDIYLNDIRHAGQHPEDYIHELATAAAYQNAGHDIILFDENVVNGKTPEFVVTDTDPQVAIECKRVRTKSIKRQRVSEKTEELLNELVKSIRTPFIGYIETGGDPSVEDLAKSVHQTPTISSLSNFNTYYLPVGKLKIMPIKMEFPFIIYQPILDKIGFHNSIREYILDPSYNNEFSVNSSDHIAIAADVYDTRQGGKIEYCSWLGVEKSDKKSTNVKRAKKQFRGVSDKFKYYSTGILQLDLPALQNLSSKNKIDLRNSLKGALAERPDIAGTVVTSLQYDDKSMNVIVQITSVPNYSPESDLPNGLNPFGINFESAIRREMERDEKMNEKLSKYPERGGEILSNDSWHLEFTASSDLLFTEEQQGFKSPESEYALVFGGDSEGGRISYLTISEGGYNISIPPRFENIDRLRIDIGFNDRKLIFSLLPWLRDEDIEPYQLTVQKPNINKNRIDKQMIKNNITHL